MFAAGPTPAPIFETFWQGRLIPGARIDTLPFIEVCQSCARHLSCICQADSFPVCPSQVQPPRDAVDYCQHKHSVCCIELKRG